LALVVLQQQAVIQPLVPLLPLVVVQVEYQAPLMETLVVPVVVVVITHLVQVPEVAGQRDKGLRVEVETATPAVEVVALGALEEAEAVIHLGLEE
jgi:hypothetical protein